MSDERGEMRLAAWARGKLYGDEFSDDEARQVVLVVLERNELLETTLRDVVSRIAAAVKFCYPDDMTPSAKRLFDSILETMSV